MVNEIRVVYVMHSSSKYEGSNKSLLCMLEGLTKLGIKPFVVMPKVGDMSMCSKFEKLKVKYVVLNYFLPIYPKVDGVKRLILFFPLLIKYRLLELLATIKVIAIAKKHAVDIIHSNVGPLLVGYKACKFLGIPHVWHLREYQDLAFDWKTIYSVDTFKKILRKKTNYPIAISKGIYDHYRLADPAKVIYNGILKYSDAQFNPEKQNYFLFVGYLKEEKGIRFLLLAFAEFIKTHNDYQLYVVGDTQDLDYKEYLSSLSIDKGISNHVKFLGNRDDIPDLMARATAIVVPSIYEGFGRITAEAMFNGCLVIGRNSTGTKEILEKEGLGLLYDCQSELVTSLSLVATLGIEKFYPVIEKAQRTALTLYCQEQNVNQVYLYYKEALQK